MKRVNLEKDEYPALCHLVPERFKRADDSLGDPNSCCIRCPDEPCIRFSVAESGGGTAISVCPVDAIHDARSETGPAVSDDCIGCGLCVMRCPVGAIHIDDGAIAVIPPSPSLTAAAADEQEFLTARSAHMPAVDWPPETLLQVAARLAGEAVVHRQEAFYPLTARLFTAAGHPAWLPARGDTSNRIDLVLIDERDWLPVEVKSYTESATINIKSVQQALENRVVLDERTFFPANPSSSTLVVGFGYPPERSDVTELVDDIEAAFDVRVGLVSLVDLYRMALGNQLSGAAIDREDLRTLRGRWHEAT